MPLFFKRPGTETRSKRAMAQHELLQGFGAWFPSNEATPEWQRSEEILEKQRRKPLRRNLAWVEDMDEESDEDQISVPVDPSRHKLWYYSSNHVLVNKERTKRAISPVIRNQELDGIAREHAERMASLGAVNHEDALKLQSKVPELGHRVGSNVAMGKTIRKIHKSMMRSDCARNNILDKKYKSMGMGTATSSSGELYICQIFC